MMNITPRELLDKVNKNFDNVDICEHSDDVTPNDIFIALGTGTHYIQEALNNKAAAVICQSGSVMPVIVSERIFEVEHVDSFVADLLNYVYGDDLAAVDLIGITGTNGKTSSAHFSCQLFSELGVKSGYIGTLGYGVIGEWLEPIRNTTPDRVSLYRYIAKLRRSGCEKIVMEVSSHAIALSRILGLSFDVGAFTNLSREHLDFHGDMQSYKKAKLSFFSDYKMRRVVINGDDRTGKELYNQCSAGSIAKAISYSRKANSSSDWYRYSHDVKAKSIRLSCGKNKYSLPVNINGRINIENIMSAAFICHASGYSFHDIRSVLDKVDPVPGRLERISVPDQPIVYIDYAHTPAGMRFVLTDKTLTPLNIVSTWCVFGCGGNRDSGKRPRMGKAAVKHAHHIVITDDNARYEQAEKILCDIFSGIDNKVGLVICRDRDRAVVYVLQSATKDDLIFLLGKGDETDIDYGDSTIAYKDADAVFQNMVQA